MKTKNTLSPKCIKVLKRIKQIILEEPERMVMTNWCSIDHAPDPDECFRFNVPECNTVCCIAGWAVAIKEMQRLRLGAIGQPVIKNILSLDFDMVTHDYEKDACEFLGLEYVENSWVSTASRLFFASSWPWLFRMALREVVPQTPEYAAVVARRIDHFIATDGQE